MQGGTRIIVGTPGKSAYQVAVDNGFTGTEAEWLDSLNAEPKASARAAQASAEAAELSAAAASSEAQDARQAAEGAVAAVAGEADGARAAAEDAATAAATAQETVSNAGRAAAQSVAAALASPINSVDPAGDFEWSGHQWDWRTDWGAPHYANLWASESGATVDGNGHLHLKIQNIDGVLHAAEIMSTRGPGLTNWGYGTYRFTIAGPVDQLHSNVILGLFVYDGGPGRPITNNEIDIELGGWSWGAPAWDHTYFRPGAGDGEWEKQAVGMVQFTATAAPFTVHEFEWLPGKIIWRSWLGEDTVREPDRVSVAVHGEEYNYQSTNGTYKGVHHVPAPGNEQVHLNLWVTNDNPESDPKGAAGAEVVVRSFEFSRLDVTAYMLERSNHLGTIDASAIEGPIPASRIDGQIPASQIEGLPELPEVVVVRGSKWFVSVGELVDYTDVVDPIDGDLFLYPTSRDLFQFNGTDWAWSGQLGAL